MSKFAEPMARLIDELKKLPGVGGKSAQRLAFHILRSSAEPAPEKMRAVLSGGELIQLQDAAGRVAVDEALVDYMLAVVKLTREHESLAMGVSPRGAQALYRAAQGMAAIDGRDYVTPDDVKRMVLPVFAHRVLVSPRAMVGRNAGAVAEGILEEILTLVEVPL